MQLKKIIIVGPAHPLRGGLSAFNERLAAALQEEGHEVVIYTFSLQYPSILFPGKTQYSSDPAPSTIDIRIRINSINPFNWIKVGNEIKREMADVVIFRFWIPFIGPSLGTIARIVRKNKHSKILGFLDNVIPHEKRPGDTALTKYFLKGCDGFIVMSKQVLSELQSFLPNAKNILLPHPIYDYGKPIARADACKALKLHPGKKNILFFGFIRGYKGLDLLLESFAITLKTLPDLHLIIAGEFYEPEQPYRNQIERLSIQNHLTLHNDYIPDAEVKNYFSAADLVVQPYKTATQSGISQLAYHFEKPMIVTAVGGLPEIVPDGVAGFVTEKEPLKIAEAIITYFQQNLEQKFTEGVRQEKQKYTWKSFVKGIENLISSLN
jgi:D-inositol-3-phosphate glycosyltransferase